MSFSQDQRAMRKQQKRRDKKRVVMYFTYVVLVTLMFFAGACAKEHNRRSSLDGVAVGVPWEPAINIDFPWESETYNSSAIKQISKDPVLIMHSEMHTDRISSIATDSLQTMLITSSADKSARIWDLSTGALKQILRPPIGLERIGRLHSGAISPDGRFAAIGGHDEVGGMYVYSLESQEIVYRQGSLKDRVNLIEFSPDGRYLAFSLITDEVHILDCTDWSKVKVLYLMEVSSNRNMRENEYPRFYTSVRRVRLGGLGFAPDGSLAVSSLLPQKPEIQNDGRFDQRTILDLTQQSLTLRKALPQIRVYDQDFKLRRSVVLFDQRQPYRLRFSPDGSKLVVSYANEFRLQVLDADSLTLLYEPDMSGMVGEKYKYLVASFSADGKTLYAGGSCQTDTLPGARYTIRSWQDQGRGTFKDHVLSSDSITDIRPRLQGGVFFCGMAPDWGIYDPEIGLVIHQTPEINDFSLWDKKHLRVNHTGDEVGFCSWGNEPREFVLSDRMLHSRASTHPFYTDTIDSLRVSDWDQSFRPRFQGWGLYFLKSLEQNICVDIAHEGKRLLFGTIWNLYCLDSLAVKVWETSTPAMVMAVKASGDGKVAVAALSDGTIRWYRMDDGKLLMTIYSLRDDKRWILYTPEGYYDCSPNAEDMIGWQLNQGYDQPSLFYAVAKFRDYFYHPEAIRSLISTLDLQESLHLASDGVSSDSLMTAKDVKDALPPKLEILSPKDGSSFNTPEITITYRLNDPSDNKLKAVKVKVDNFSVLNIKDPQIINGVGSFNLKLQPRNTRIKITAEGGKGIDVREISLKWAGDQSLVVPLSKPRLFVLAVGVGDYRNNIKRLNFPPKDARDFTNTLEQHFRPMYDSLAVRVITDADATLSGVIEGLDWLASVCSPSDVAMIFISGHGVNSPKGVYHFLPVDALKYDIEQSCLSYSVLEAKLLSIAGKVILFADTCFAGGLADESRFRLPDMNGLGNRLSSDEVGVVVFASSTASQYSQEKVSWDNGAFTKALVEGLQGKADPYGEKKVTHKGLDAYITYRVESMTQKAQQPVTTPGGITNYDLILFDEE